MVNAHKTALTKLVDLEQETVVMGFTWPDLAMVLDQVDSECLEVRESIDLGESQDRLQEEIGDLIHATISLCMTAGFDVEETLGKVEKKFSSRVGALKVVAQEQGYKNLKGQSTEVLMDLWRIAKKRIDGKIS